MIPPRRPTHTKVPIELLQLAVDELADKRALHQREVRRLDIIINGIQATAEGTFAGPDVNPPASPAPGPPVPPETPFTPPPVAEDQNETPTEDEPPESEYLET